MSPLKQTRFLFSRSMVARFNEKFEAVESDLV
jgi:hypothetical protein